MVVPEGALTNITAALLVVEPTDLALDADLLAKARLTSLGRIAAQKIVRVEHSGIGSHHDSVDLIGFEPDARLHRPAVARREAQPAPADGRRHPGSGPRRRAGHAAPDLRQAAHRLRPARPHRRRHARARRVHVLRHAGRAGRRSAGARSRPAVLAPGKVTGFLVELAPGATALQARFAILSSVKGVKVVSRRHDAVAASARAWRRCSTASSR